MELRRQSRLFLRLSVAALAFVFADATACSRTPGFTNPDQSRQPSPLGSACGSAPECQTGFCAAGICCDAPCDGTCMQCAADGRCSVVPVDDAACGVVDCDALDSTCRDFHDL